MNQELASMGFAREELSCQTANLHRQGSHGRQVWTHVTRLSPNSKPRFTDEEVLTVYLFGLLAHPGGSIEVIHQNTPAHLGE